ncbi:hypothetical protein LINPERHAP1_LOCUS35182, partial [Linum perenne]
SSSLRIHSNKRNSIPTSTAPGITLRSLLALGSSMAFRGERKGREVMNFRAKSVLLCTKSAPGMSKCAPAHFDP